MADLDVLILMGSASDWKHVQGAVEILRRLGLRFDVQVSSAHRTPERTLELVRAAEDAGCQAFICAAGMAAHLAGAVAAHTVRPVLGVPLPGGVLDGVDALLSTVQMPAGIPVATFAVGSAGAKNAAFFAGQIVAGRRAEVWRELESMRREGAENVLRGNQEVAHSVVEKADG